MYRGIHAKDLLVSNPDVEIGMHVLLMTGGSVLTYIYQKPDGEIRIEQFLELLGADGWPASRHKLPESLSPDTLRRWADDIETTVKGLG